MKLNSRPTVILAVLLLIVSAPAFADFMVTWTAPDFELQAGSSIPLCVGDMVGNGNQVIVGRFNTVTQVRDAVTGEVLKQFEPYECLGTAYAMVDIDGDGTMECIVTSDAETSVIDWVLVTSNGDYGDVGAAAEIDFSLYPNPSIPGATIAFTLAKAGNVEISVYDVAGRRVRQLLIGFQANGRQEISWDGRDDAGIRMASGTYLFELRVDGRQAASHKSVLLR